VTDGARGYGDEVTAGQTVWREWSSAITQRGEGCERVKFQP
jgi:hypothetical protein